MPQLKEDNDSISANFASQILSLKIAETLLLLNSLITGLSSSWPGCSVTHFPGIVF